MVNHIYSHHFHLLKNRELDSLYFMNALKVFATSLVGVFVPIYFYKIGIPIWAIIFFWFLRALYRVICTYLTLPLVRKLSDKMMMFLGIPFLIIYYLLLQQLDGVGVLFCLAPLTTALYSIFFDSGYHLDFSSSTKGKNKGEKVGINRVVMDLVRFITPVLGGYIIINFGFGIIFFISSVLLFLSVLPLFFFPKRNFSKKINKKNIKKVLFDKSFSNFRLGMVGYVSDGVINSYIWPIFIFLIVGNIERLGFFISIGLLFGAVASYIIGKLSDKKKISQMFNFVGFGNSFIWFLRSVFESFEYIIGTHISGYIFRDALMSLWTNQYYELLEKKEDPSVFIIAHEMFYSVVRLFVYPFFILLALFLPTNVFFLGSFILTGILSSLIIYAGR